MDLGGGSKSTHRVTETTETPHGLISCHLSPRVPECPDQDFLFVLTCEHFEH